MTDEPTSTAVERAAALDQIVQWGSPVLRSEASPVRAFDEDLLVRAARMVVLMDAADGTGLAAPQIGDLSRLFVYRPAAGGPVRAVVNPVITERSDETAVAPEGCLSLGRAGIVVEVERPISVTVEGFDVHGEPVTIAAEGQHARVLQHEIDHLDGVLMLQRTTPEQRKAAIVALREGVSYAPEHLAAAE